MKNLIVFFAAGALMLAATAATCLLLQEEAPKAPVYYGEVRGRLSAPSPSPAMAPAAARTAQDSGVLPERKMESADLSSVVENRNSEGLKSGSAADGVRKEELSSAKPQIPPQHADASGKAEARMETAAEGTPDAVSRKGKGDARTEPHPAAGIEPEPASASKPADSGHSEKKNPQMKKPAQLQEKQKPAYDKSVTSASFSMSGSTIRLTLRGNAPMVGHYFTLKNPERIVLDLAGGWDVSVPPVPSNRLIRSVRTGRHEDKTRLVFDMKTEGRAVLVPIDRNSLELSIR